MSKTFTKSIPDILKTKNRLIKCNETASFFVTGAKVVGNFYLRLMRIDKFLWCVRKYKTRSLASEQVKKDRVKINEVEVKASREVRVGDIVTYKKEGAELQMRVLDIPKSRIGAKLVPDFIKDVTPAEELEKQEFIKMMQRFNRPKGTGRPTKKERRDLDDFKGS